MRDVARVAADADPAVQRLLCDASLRLCAGVKTDPDADAINDRNRDGGAR
ncbi:MAG TPA: hypothetical protein VIJ77_04755 [Candidatus Tumulicola sp.]